MELPGATLLENPVTSGEKENALHVNNVPATWEVSEMLVMVLSQIESVLSTLERSGFGKTVNTTSTESPLQLFAEGSNR